MSRRQASTTSSSSPPPAPPPHPSLFPSPPPHLLRHINIVVTMAYLVAAFGIVVVALSSAPEEVKSSTVDWTQESCVKFRMLRNDESFSLASARYVILFCPCTCPCPCPCPCTSIILILLPQLLPSTLSLFIPTKT